MRIKMALFSITAIICLHANAQMQDNAAEPGNEKKPKMQVVFALDATGSMSGLIKTAKEKIWSIVSSLTQTQPAPDIEVGLIFYRDRGDQFITKRIPLTDSIDMVYSELMKIQAAGGGDGPESVNQGLNEAVELFKWDKDTSTYKSIFLVGDYEPHMDYKNDVPYYVTCGIAKQKDIVLNTVLMGNNRVAEKVWLEIARCNDGAFINVNMEANDITINTPYDAAIADINDHLDDLRYYYGNSTARTSGETLKMKGKVVAKGTSAAVKAQRAEYNTFYYSKKSGVKQNELLSDYASKNISLDSLKTEDLPAEFKSISKDSLAIIVKQKLQLRDSLTKQLTQKVAERNAYIETELSKRDKKEVEGSFNNVIYLNIQKQTQKKKIVLKGKTKY